VDAAHRGPSSSFTHFSRWVATACSPSTSKAIRGDLVDRRPVIFAVSLQSGSKSRSEKRSPCSFCSSRRSSSSSSSSEITRRCRSRAQSCCSSTAIDLHRPRDSTVRQAAGRSAVSSSGRRGPSATRCRLAEIDHKASTTDTDCCKSVPVRLRYGLRSHRKIVTADRMNRPATDLRLRRWYRHRRCLRSVRYDPTL